MRDPGAGSKPRTASEYLPEIAPEVLASLFERAAAPPFVQIQLLRALKILLEVIAQTRSKARIADRHVHLVVQFERAIVEVRGPEHAPHAIDDHRRCMH